MTPTNDEAAEVDRTGRLDIIEHMFDDVSMTGPIHSAAELETIRRSAAMAPLPPFQVTELLAGYAALAREREQIRSMLGELGPSWRTARTVLNQLSELVADEPAGPPPRPDARPSDR